MTGSMTNPLCTVRVVNYAIAFAFNGGRHSKVNTMKTKQTAWCILVMQK